MGQFKPSWLLYGATGYSGRLIAAEAKKRGLNLILGGRNEAALTALGKELELPYRCIDLNDRNAVDRGALGVRLILNCASPFAISASVLAQACIRSGAYYLDLSSEVADFRSLFRLHARAEEAGVLLMCGVGMGILPTDALALHLKQRLPSAVTLRLAFYGENAKPSRGTLRTLLESLRQRGFVREGGQLKETELTFETRQVDFGPAGRRRVISFPWRGDLFTAGVSTGIQFVYSYAALPLLLQWLMRGRKQLAKGWIGDLLERYVNGASEGPTDEERNKGRTWFWGEVVNDVGTRASTVISAPEGYTLSTSCALYAVERLLGGDSPEGWRTPAQVFGTDPLRSLPGLKLTDR
ncbi:MAG: saccharopine dehydrogenase NADP-binding domain-containing protein [Xanthomonadales bacterium]|nr:saccharopine dehydrogenase NADP-binding domain-containing protein [Xanthomonadales bacterium]